MKNRNDYWIYILTNIVIFVPAPPYLGYGIILILGLNFIFTMCMLFSAYIKDLESQHRRPLLLINAGLATVIYQLIVAAISPIISLTLGFILYLIPLSVLTFGSLFNYESSTTSDFTINRIKTMFSISTLTLLFFFIREFFSFGTISYPTPAGIATIALPYQIFDNHAFVWSSIPGALFLLTLFIVIIPLMSRLKDKNIEEPSE